ncbi:YktB family protein [Paenibacillus senegalensis]|uniref:YktB family protein n=1 Tax=Paenibacillus senegalensis TaxID=1465766 RepID=UPI000288CFDC|nr:DUF1054 domain-containing protein [Paenibacillus senegalensis]
MDFRGFSAEDFDVFTIPGLEPRMEALIARVRPKLTELGDHLSSYLSAACGAELFPHVARHARRTVNPPDDTWVAWASSKKGYKSLPHFQLGLWNTHLFIQFGVIYECPHKVHYANQLHKQKKQIRSLIPDSYYWSMDHTKPEVIPGSEMDEERFAQLIHRLKTVKKAEALCGLRVERDDPILTDGKAFIELAEQTFTRLVPLYHLSV